MDYTLNITWGQRVHICNMFPTVGTLHDMHISHVMRDILIEAVDPAVLAQNGITKNELGEYTLPEKNEKRPSEITLNDNSLKLFYEFVQDLSSKRIVQLAYESIFTLVVETYEESQESQETEQPEQEPQQL